MALKPVQLLFNFPLDAEATFSHFLCENEQQQQPLLALEQACEQAIQPQLFAPDSLVLWGAAGCGLSHLLQAVVHRAQALQVATQYLPLRELLPYPAAAVCEDIERAPLVCLDDLDAIAGHLEWETALFHVYNRIKDARHTLIMASHTPLPQLPWALPDLRSRLLSGMVFRIPLLDDSAKIQALMLRAHARGFDLPAEAAKYLVTHTQRSLPHLFMLLNKLDYASLQQQRKITVPFVKALLQEHF